MCCGLIKNATNAAGDGKRSEKRRLFNFCCVGALKWGDTPNEKGECEKRTKRFSCFEVWLRTAMIWAAAIANTKWNGIKWWKILRWMNLKRHSAIQGNGRVTANVSHQFSFGEGVWSRKRFRSAARRSLETRSFRQTLFPSLVRLTSNCQVTLLVNSVIFSPITRVTPLGYYKFKCANQNLATQQLHSQMNEKRERGAYEKVKWCVVAAARDHTSYFYRIVYTHQIWIWLNELEMERRWKYYLRRHRHCSHSFRYTHFSPAPTPCALLLLLLLLAILPITNGVR